MTDVAPVVPTAAQLRAEATALLAQADQVEHDVRAVAPVARPVVTDSKALVRLAVSDTRSVWGMFKGELWKLAGAGAVAVGATGTIGYGSKSVATIIAGVATVLVHEATTWFKNA